MKKLLLCLLAVMMLAGCTSKPKVKVAKDQKFVVEDLTIYLPSYFESMTYKHYNACYQADEEGILLLREEASLFNDFKNLTIEGYLGKVISNNDLNSKVEKKDGVWQIYWEYTSSSDLVLCYFATGLKGKDCFWLVQYTFDKDDYAKYAKLFPAYIANISVK